MRARTIAFAIVVLVAVGGSIVYVQETHSASEPPARPQGQQRGVPVVVAPVERKDMPIEVSAIGTAQASETVVLRSRIDGEITAVRFREGDEVKAGDTLFTLDSRALEAQLAQAEANLARDRAQLDNAKRDLDRKTNLAKSEFTTRASVDQSNAAYAAAVSTVKADEAAVQNLRVQITYAVIKAPIDGRTGGVTLTKGNMVRANDNTQTLVTINRTRPIKVGFAVPQKYFDAVRTAMAKGSIETFARVAGGNGEIQPGTVYFIDNQIDVTTGTFQLKASFDNSLGALWPGMMVSVVVRLGTQPDALVIPTVAVSPGQNGPFVFVVKPDQSSEVRNITVARESGDRTVVEDGLKDGEQVVTDGQLRLTNGTRVSVRTTEASAEAASPAGKVR